MSWTIEKTKLELDINKPLLIVGLPGIASVGKIVVDFIIESKKAKCIAKFHSHSMPHTVFVNESNLIEMPRIELYLLKNKENDLLLLSGDAQPIDERAAHEFCETILNYCKELGCKNVVSIGGIALKRIPKKPKLYATGTNKKVINDFCKNTSCDPNVYGIVGPIIGITGLIAAKAGEQNLQNICLLAETYGHPFYLGIPSAKEVLKLFNTKYKLELDLSSLDEEIKDMEADLLRFSSLKVKHPVDKETSYIG